MTCRDLLAPCLGAALIGGMLVQSCKDTGAQSAAIVTEVRRPQAADLDSVHVVLLFNREGCNVYRFIDSYGAHYFAGRPLTSLFRGGGDHPCALGR
jgi:hypothetical protein